MLSKLTNKRSICQRRCSHHRGSKALSKQEEESGPVFSPHAHLLV